MCKGHLGSEAACLPGRPEGLSPAPLAVGRGRASWGVATCSQGMALGYISEQNPNSTGLRGGYVGGRQTGGPSPSPLSVLLLQNELPKARL